MINGMKFYLKFPWNVAIVFGLVIGGYFIFGLTSYLPKYKTLLIPSKSTSFNSFSEHSQYSLILSLQEAFIRNAKNIGPVVVNISKVHEANAINTLYIEPPKVKQSWFLSMKSWFKNNLHEKKYISETIGSGVIINKNGYILTNYHVIESINKILIRLSDKRHFFAKVVGIDPLTDLAVLKINSFRGFTLSLLSSMSQKLWKLASG